MTDLPQPIYPTPGPGPGPAGGTGPGIGGPPPPQGPPPGWPTGPPPGAPTGPPTGPGGPWGGPPSGPPAPKRKIEPMVLVVIALVVVGAVVAGLIALGSGDDDGDTADKKRTTSSTTDRDEGDTGAGTGTDTGTGDDPEPDDDVAERAQTVAGAQIDTASDTTLSCWADELATDTDLLDLIEPMSTSGVTFDDATDAEHYASFIMLCAPPSEVQEFFLGAFTNLTDSQLQCLSDDMDLWTVDTWEEWIATVTQPDLATSADEYVQQVTGYC